MRKKKNKQHTCFNCNKRERNMNWFEETKRWHCRECMNKRHEWTRKMLDQIASEVNKHV